MTASFWFAVFIFLSLRSLLEPVLVCEQFAPRVLACALGAAMCGAMSIALRRLSRYSLRIQIPVTIVLALLTSAFYGAAVDGIFRLMLPPDNDPWYFTVVGRAMGYVWIIASWYFAYFAMTFRENARQNELRLLEAQALTADAQNRMLRYQINPHFLFNTLNALQTLMSDRKVSQAKQMVLSLADFLRYSLAQSPTDRVTLGEEIEAQAAYLSIEQARFGKRLHIIVDVPAGLTRARVPSLILQPLIENAVKYAVAPSRDPVTIKLIATAEGDRLRISVTDDGTAGPDRPPSLGLGLENVRRRLELAYEGRAAFTFGPTQPSGFSVAMLIPLET